MHVGLDIGYGFTKVAGDDCVQAYPSAVAPITLSQLETDLQEAGQTISLNGKRFVVGERALRFKRQSFSPIRHRSFVETETFKILFYSAIARFPSPLFVVIDLPVDAYQNKAYRELCKQRIKAFPFFEGELAVLPQSLAGLYHIVLDREGEIVNGEFLDARCAIIDIGFYTTDIVLLDKLDIVYAETIRMGVSLACEALCQEIQRQENRALTLHEAQEILKTQKLLLYGEEKDISLLVQKIKKDSFELLKNRVVDRIGYGEDLHAVIFIGGGSLLYQGQFTKTFRSAYYPPTPAFANALGCYKYAKRKWR